MCREFYQQIQSVSVEFAPSFLLKSDKFKIQRVTRVCYAIAVKSIKFEVTPFHPDKQKITVFNHGRVIYELICHFDLKKSFYIFHGRSVSALPQK